ncbi:MAG: DNA repair protein RecN [Clostridia bacterium]
MITTLHIKNIGIIDDLSVDLRKGFNVLTGETGAGKTLIIDSLEIIAGGRFSKEMIRKGESYSFVELSMYLPEHEKAMDGNIIVSREIYTNGRNACKINGRLVTVNELKEFMQEMIDIHGQHDNQTLLNVATHNKLLDDFSGLKMLGIKTKYRKRYQEYLEIVEELKRNYGDEKEKQRKLDLLSYQVKEIEEANLKDKEDEILEEKRKKMLNAEKIAENLTIADGEINQNGIDSIGQAIRALEKIEGIDKQYDATLENLRSISYELEEIARDLASMTQENEFNEREREEIEARLDLIYSLKRKYGNTIEEIKQYAENRKQEIYEIENLEEYTKGLKAKLEKKREEMLELAKQMHEIRQTNGKILTEKINQELTELQMKNANISVEVSWNEDKQFHKNGLDKVEFLIRTNIGEEAKPLTKIASGGEMSRIMLAIKTVLANIDKVPVLVFDEIDTGISGKAANSVSEKLQKIAKNHQVLCVTHLATIAAKGDHNYYISKEVQGNKTKTKIRALQEEEIIQEIARIASGELTEIAIEHAKELRKTKEVA